MTQADKYKMLLDLIDEGYCIIQMMYDSNGKAVNWRYLEVNRAFELNNGLTDALGKTILEITPDIEPKWFEHYDNVVRTGQPIRFTEDSKALNRVFNLYCFRVGNPEDRQVAVIFTDITRQVRAEAELRKTELEYRNKLEKEVLERTVQLQQSKDLLQATLDSSLEMIQVFEAVRDDKGKIIDFKWILNNDVSTEIYGDVIGKSLLQHNPGVVETGIFGHFVEVTETGIPQHYEKHYVHEQFDGWFYQSAVKLGDGVATSTSNITERKLAEQQNSELNALLVSKNRELENINSELTTFSNIAATDYSETLRTIYINLENLIKNDAARLSNTGKANLRKAQSAIQKMKLLTEDIVAFSKLPFIDSANTSISLNDALNDSLEDLKEKIKVSNAVIGNHGLPVIQGYPLLVSLLFHHLLDNAIKFRKEGLHPVIDIKSALVHKSVLPETKAMPYYEITFIDNGIGFGPDEANNIFTIFYRLHERGKYKGSGIGLAVCHKIMALHGGYITAQGEPGGGCTITCLFPA